MRDKITAAIALAGTERAAAIQKQIKEQSLDTALGIALCESFVRERVLLPASIKVPAFPNTTFIDTLATTYVPPRLYVSLLLLATQVDGGECKQGAGDARALTAHNRQLASYHNLCCHCRHLITQHACTKLPAPDWGEIDTEMKAQSRGKKRHRVVTALYTCPAPCGLVFPAGHHLTNIKNHHKEMHA